MFVRLIYIAFAALLMAGCSLLPTGMPDTNLASHQNQRIASAGAALQDLDEIDTLLRLNNRRLANQIETSLKSQAASSGRYAFGRIKLDFARQTVSLNAVVDINDSRGNIIAASVSGEILFDFSGDRLEWFPHFKQLRISSRDFSFAEKVYIEPSAELTQSLFQQLNSDIADTLIRQGDNTIPLSAVPLGEIQVGAELPGFVDTPARQTQALRGVFMVAGSAILIDSSVTSIALDMTFIPDLSTCPADVTVSRAEFASNIESREPVGSARSLSTTTEVSYFFTEISGAKRALSIIHYWFADGLPVTAEELAVGPSARWRTWSSRGAGNPDARRWEVLVVEKESGCILHTGTLRTTEPVAIASAVEPTGSRRAFEAYRDKFRDRTAAFSIFRDKPAIALIEVRRPFFTEVLRASLSDVSMDAEFDSSAFSPMHYSARLQPFDTHEISCEQRNCPPAPVCKTNLGQCKRLRDTRDCASCQFRNPLNNRCISEAVDPLCEASRSRQNRRYEAGWAACISDAESLRQECDQLAAQATRSCQIEAGFEDSACAAVKTSISTLKPGMPLARVTARTRTNGVLSASFSNFRIEDDLKSLKLDITLKTDLQLEGELNFSPGKITQPLADCITAWSKPFKSRFISSPMVNNLFSNFEEYGSLVKVNWSGFGLTIDTSPSPLESVFMANPQLLANCKIGLTAKMVELTFRGEDAGFFSGQVELEIQPLPTSIHLAPATIELGEYIYSAAAMLTAGHLRYDIRE